MRKELKDCAGCSMKDKRINGKPPVCNPDTVLVPRTKQAFENIMKNNGLHMICRRSPFRQQPWEG